jgi:protein XagA
MLRRLLFIFIVFWCAPARAGAFMQPTGQGQIISQLAFSEAGRAYDSLGRAAAIPAWRKFELSSYGEYGVADWLTVIGEPSWFSFRAPTPRPSTYFGPLGSQTISRVGVAEAGARVRLFEWDDNVLSAQATGRYAAGGGAAEPYIDMGRRAQADVRLLLGRKFEIMGLAGYSDMQVAFRTKGPFGNQLRFDMTYALQPFARTTLMLQSFTVLTPGRLGGRFALSQKLQGSVLFEVTDWLSLQVGALMAMRGVNSAAEKGIVSGVWLRF